MATKGAVGDGLAVAPVTLSSDGSGSVHVANAEALFLGDYSRQGHDLLIEHNGTSLLVEKYFDGAGGNLVGPNGAFLTPSVVHALAGPVAPGQYAENGAPGAAALTEIGKVVSIEGTAAVTHSDGVAGSLGNGDPVYQGDVVSTGAGSKLGISFIDDSVFSMSADARMVLDELIFDPAKVADSSMVVNLVQGSFVFVTGQVAPSGSMKVETPVATMGIRGTTPKVTVSSELGVTEFSILPDPGSGKVGSYVLIDKTTGAILGTVESVGDKWVITSLSDEAVKVAKSGLDLLEDEAAISDIRDAVSHALGQRTELNGASSYQQVAFDASASSSGQGGETGGNNNDHSTGETTGGTDPTPDKDDPPIAGDDAFSTNEDAILVGGNVINASGGGADVDPDGFALTVTQVNGQALTFNAGGTASVVLPPNAYQQTVGANLLISKTGGITYDPSSAFNYLAVGEQRVETFTYQVTDKNGFTDTATVNITVTGRNDAPVIISGPATTTIAESSEIGGVGGGFSGGPVSGELSFNDADISDTGHTYQVVSVVETPLGGAPPNPLGGNGLLALLNTNGSFDDGASLTGGTIKWNFTGSEDQFDYLAAGESVRLTYTIQVTDPYGATDTQTVNITVIGAADDGSNDEPVISVEIGDSAAAPLTETNAGLTTLTANGPLTQLTVTEVDLTDVVSLSVVSVDPSGTTDGLGPTNSDLKAMMSLSTASILTDFVATTDNFGWTFNSQTEAFDYLAKDETLVLTYTVRATDSQSAYDDQTIVITITGTNDVPVVAATDVTGGVLELVTPAGNLTDTGTIGFTDVDLTDGHTISPTITASAGALGVLTASVTTDTTAGVGGVITWNYTVAASAVEYLAADQTKVETFTITLDDGNGGTVDRTITVTVTGTNDAPVVAAGDVTGGVLELVTPAGNLTDTGTIGFTDVDLTDGHTISPTITASAGALGVLTASVTTDTTAGVGGVITWNYTVAASAVEYLAADQTKVETFTITLDDGNGGTVDRTITVTVTGTNDVPVVAATDVTGGVLELVTPAGNLTDTGTIGFTDVDLTDGHTISPTITASAGALGVLTASVTTDTTAGVGGVITWNYTVAASAVEYLAADQTKVETFTITLNDGNGGTVDRTITVTVTGTDDAPELTAVAGQDVGSITEGAAVPQAGTLDFTDVDLTDMPAPDVTSHVFTALDANGEEFLLTSDQQNAFEQAFSVALGSGSANDGTVDWTFDLDGYDLSFLGEGEAVTATFTVSVDDGNGGVDTKDVEITINGVNGGDRDDTLSGTPGDDELLAGLGNDTVYGLGGNDYLEGGEGDDTLIGGAGDDYMAGGEGTDTYIGGGDGNPDEYDGISFRDETGSFGVIADLSAGPGNVRDTYGNIETATGIEEVDGSQNDDTLIGNAADNYFSGREGADSYDGGAGGFDQVTFDDETSVPGSEHGAVVDLAAGTGTDTYGYAESFTSIEVLRGSQYGDTFIGDANDNTFRGLAGDDTIDGGGGWDQVRYDRDANAGGTAGVTVDLANNTATDGFGDTDTLSNIEAVRGTQFADNLTGDDNDNELIGLGGADILTGGDGNDWLDGGEGNDTLIGGAGDDYMAGGEGTDTYIGGGDSNPDEYDGLSFREEGGPQGVIVDLSGGPGNVTDTYGNTKSATGIEEVDGSQNDDILIGNNTDNYFRGFDGADSYDGGAGGFDQVSYDGETGGAGVVIDLSNVHVDGYATGTDTYGNEEKLKGIEVLRGSEWADTFIGDANNNTFRGLAGDDTIDGGDGWDQVRYDRDANKGGMSGVTVNLALGTATDGFGDTDTLSNIEAVRGTQFADNLTGDDNDNEFVGGGGNDVIDGGGEGGDWDTVGYWNAEAGIVVDMKRGEGQVINDGSGGTDTLIDIENVSGSQHDDIIVGNWDGRSYYGDGGSDLLIGGIGDEWLNGGDGDDRIDGGAGTDTMVGEGGADTFFLAPGTGQDEILDFNVAEGDVIDLQAYGFSSMAALSALITYNGNTVITFDVDNSVTVVGVDLTNEPGAFIFAGSPNLVQGTDGDDQLFGTSGNDLILPQLATADFGDEIQASLGNDEIAFAGAAGGDGYYGIAYWTLPDGVALHVNIGATSGTIEKVGYGTDTLSHLDAIDGVEGGLGIYAGNDSNDSYIIDVGGVEYVNLNPGGGADQLNVTDTSVGGIGYMDVDLYWAYSGVTVNVPGGNVTDGISTMSLTGSVDQWRGTAGDDTFIGGAGDESFITNGGYNTVNGAGGFDRVRYDRNGVTNLSITYSMQGAAVVTGLWAGHAFSDELTSVEWIRGAREGTTEFVGSDGDERFDARGGVNYVEGGEGNDILNAGGDGNMFSFAPDSGEDTIGNFVVGRDKIDLSAYSFADESDFQDFTFDGNNTVIDLNGTDTITLTDIDLTSVDPSDIFIFDATNIAGTLDDDVLMGNADANTLDGLAGNDAIYGFDGADQLFGGADNDQLFGGDGADQLTGGAGADEFILYAGETGVDEILDFETDNDLISLFGYDENTPISLADNGIGGSNLLVDSQVVATLDNVSPDTDFTVQYDMDHHVITMMAMV